MTENERYSRNIALFGEQGQRKIQDCTIGVVGLGGLGSQVAQQTALLGVRNHIFADHDLITRSSLNRVVGATEGDVDKTPKVKVAERLVLSVQPTARITTFTTAIDSAPVKAALERVDLIFGCVDNDAARLVLTEFASLYGKPYIDIATDTGGDRTLWYGGRVLFSLDGNICLSCAGELDQRQISRASMTAKQLIEDQQIYGVPSLTLNGTGPAVVSLNGVVASLAVTEFMVWITALRPPKSHVRYRADLGIVTLNVDKPTADCYYCTKYRGARSLIGSD